MQIYVHSFGASPNIAVATDVGTERALFKVGIVSLFRVVDSQCGGQAFCVGDRRRPQLAAPIPEPDSRHPQGHASVSHLVLHDAEASALL